MLTDRAITFLQPLVFSENAKRQTCLLPLGGIYWDDEIPDFKALMEIPEDDRLGIYQLFRIRFKIWEGEALTARDKDFWNVALTQVPNYALFRRLQLSDEDRAAQEQFEREAVERFEALFADADEVSVTEKDRFQSFSTTCNLKQEEETRPIPKPWWMRIFSR